MTTGAQINDCRNSHTKRPEKWLAFGYSSISARKTPQPDMASHRGRLRPVGDCWFVPLSPMPNKTAAAGNGDLQAAAVGGTNI